MELNSQPSKLWQLFKISLETKRYHDTIQFLQQIISSFKTLTSHQLQHIIGGCKLIMAQKRSQLLLLQKWVNQNPGKWYQECRQYEKIVKEQIKELFQIMKEQLHSCLKKFDSHKKAFCFYKLLADIHRYLLQLTVEKSPHLIQEIDQAYAQAYADANKKQQLFTVEGIGLMINFTLFQAMYLDRVEALDNINLIYRSVLHEVQKWGQKREEYRKLLQILLQNKLVIESKLKHEKMKNLHEAS